MRRKQVVSFPQMGSYNAVFSQLLRHLLPKAEIMPPPPITNRTVELGSRHSPDFVCMPFKFNIGNYIEALDLGANVLFQTGTGCRYGYYGELQEQILRDLGYEFRFACLSRERARPGTIVQAFQELGCELPVGEVLSAVYMALRSIHFMDRFEFWMRENMGFEAEPGACEGIQRRLTEDIARADSIKDLHRAQDNCSKAVKVLKIKRPEDCLKVGVVGELYTLMEPFSNFYLEKQLAKEGICVSRVMSVWFLLFGKSSSRALRQSGGYLRFLVGANGVDSVSQSLDYAKKGYDGILHIKSFGCIPELNATPALMNLSRDQGIPVLHLSFDSHTAEAAVATRLEAFSDMIRMKKEFSVKNHAKLKNMPFSRRFAATENNAQNVHNRDPSKGLPF